MMDLFYVFNAVRVVARKTRGLEIRVGPSADQNAVTFTFVLAGRSKPAVLEVWRTQREFDLVTWLERERGAFEKGILEALADGED